MLIKLERLFRSLLSLVQPAVVSTFVTCVCRHQFSIYNQNYFLLRILSEMLIELSAKTADATEEPFVFIKPSRWTNMDRILELKSGGNQKFKCGLYANAIALYTRAIALFTGPDVDKYELANCYQNRAAAHEQLGNFADCVDDASSAIDINDVYAKAYFRRAKGYMGQQKRYLAMEDAMQSCVLAKFRIDDYNKLATEISEFFRKK